MSGQLKTMFDRANPLYNADCFFKEVYLLATAAEDESNTFEGKEKAVKGWVDCFEKARFCGSIFAGGVNVVGEIVGHKALLEAYEIGKRV